MTKTKIVCFNSVVIMAFTWVAVLGQETQKIQAAAGGMQQITVPPKGFNSWDSYGMYPTQEAMLKNLAVMAKRLKPYGYEYFVIDAGWNKVKDKSGKIVSQCLDEYSRYIPDKETFPGGLKAVAAKAHAAGLKFGIHIMRGISRRAYNENMPILGTNYTARDIADTTSTCRWNSDNYGVNMDKPGAQAYYDSYITQLIGWGVDFIKADDITGFPKEIDAVLHGIKKTGKKVILSLSPGGDAKPEFFETYKQADMLRVTKDVWDDQVGIDRVFTAWKLWNKIDHAGFWLDMDMIPFGHLCLQHPDPNYLSAKPNEKLKGEKQLEHMSFFTKDQQCAFMAMRALSASPLMMGGDLPTSDAFSFKLLTNKSMLACNENGVAGSLVSDKDSMEVWKVADKKKPGKGWVGVFNRGPRQQSVDVTSMYLGLGDKPVSLFNIWDEKDLGEINNKSAKRMQVNAGGVLFCSYKIN